MMQPCKESNVNDSPHWPDGLSRHLSLPHTSLYDNLDASATRYPQKTAIHFYGRALTYLQLRKEVEALAGFLQLQCGVARGDRVALYMQNSPQYVIGYFAILRANAVIVPVNPMNTSAEFRHVIEDCGAKVVLLGEELFENACPLLGRLFNHAIVTRYADYIDEATDLPLPAVLTERASRLDALPEFSAGVAPKAVRWRAAIDAAQQPSAKAVSPDDLAVIPYTSGTTGVPKGCMQTHRWRCMSWRRRCNGAVCRRTRSCCARCRCSMLPACSTR
jgi:fatty-acyl-CoA synthase